MAGATESTTGMLSACSVSYHFLRKFANWPVMMLQIADILVGQRRKEQLEKLQAAQKEANVLRSKELQRLRRKNLALAQENESLRAACGSSTSSPSSSISSGVTKSSSLNYQQYAYLPFNLEPAATLLDINSPLISPATDTSSLVVLMPNDIREIRRNLHQIFAPIIEISTISDPQEHLLALANLAPKLPHSLRPTYLQLTTLHHIYIDLIPSPGLRDRLIASGPENCSVFLMEVCTIACDIEDNGQMTIWGEDWLNEFSWEFSEAVLERWGGWLLTNEWARRANFWRLQRGLPTLPGFEV